MLTYLIRTAKQQDVDGFLVGGASLKPEFADIINAKKEWSLWETRQLEIINLSCIFDEYMRSKLKANVTMAESIY